MITRTGASSRSKTDMNCGHQVMGSLESCPSAKKSPASIDLDQHGLLPPSFASTFFSRTDTKQTQGGSHVGNGCYHGCGPQRANGQRCGPTYSTVSRHNRHLNVAVRHTTATLLLSITRNAHGSNDLLARLSHRFMNASHSRRNVPSLYGSRPPSSLPPPFSIHVIDTLAQYHPFGRRAFSVVIK